MAGSAQRSRGLYRLLERPAVFSPLMRLLGGDSGRERIVRDFLPPLTAARLLDIGCGTGALLDALPPDVAYVGVDINPAYIEMARRLYGSRGQFFCARAGDEIDFAGNTFDVIAAIALLHHLEDAEVSRVLDTAVRLLRPGGMFVSIDPTKHEGQSAASRLLVSLDRGRCVRAPGAYRDLLASRFAEIDDRVVTDLVRIPYSHYVAQARSTSAR